MVRFREWGSFCSRLRNLPPDPIEDAHGWMVGCFWFAAATLISLLVVVLASSKRSAWLLPSLIVITIASLILTEFFRRTKKRARSGRTTQLEMVVGEMEEFAANKRDISVRTEGSDTAGGLSDSTETEQKLRSVLRVMRSDIKDGVAKIEQAVSAGKYWGITEGVLRDGAWKKNQDFIAAQPGMTDLYDVLEIAFGHIKRINGFTFLRNVAGGQVRPDDHLEEAFAALCVADDKIVASLVALDGGGSKS